MVKKKSFKTIAAKNTSRFHISEPPDYDDLKPIFSFHHMDYGGKCCLSRCNGISKASIAITILQLSQDKWSKILSTRRENHGKENIPVRQFKVQLPRIVTPDVKSLMVFRFSKSERMAGIRIKDVYHIIVVGADLYNH